MVRVYRNQSAVTELTASHIGAQSGRGGEHYAWRCSGRQGVGLGRHALAWPCQDNRVARERGRGYADEMMELSYRRRRFPPIVIQHAVWRHCQVKQGWYPPTVGGAAVRCREVLGTPIGLPPLKREGARRLTRPS